MTDRPDSMLARPSLTRRGPGRAKSVDPVDPWPSDDPLGEALRYVTMTGAFYCRSELTEPWGLTLPPMPDHLWFHAPIRGRCRLETDGSDARLLEAGGLALVPHGEGHRLRSEPGVAAPEILQLEREAVSGRYELLRHGGGGEPAVLICGAVRLGGAAAPNLRRLLPHVLVAGPVTTPRAEWMHTLIGLMGAEAEARRAGSEAVVTRLADVVVTLAVRAWMERDADSRTGWLAALHDEQIGRALTLMHRQPELRWTVGTLARRVAMSRSAFAARFGELVGEPPMGYLARWRMQLAQVALRDEGVSVSQVARRLGYRSEAAFRRAFKRMMGVSPGAVRRSGSAG
jgi:AraC-like DNA-binding protein